MPRNSNCTSFNVGIFSTWDGPSPPFARLVFWDILQREIWGVLTKNSWGARWNAERLGLLIETDSQSDAQRFPAAFTASILVWRTGGYFEKYKFHFIFSIFLNRAFEPTCFHRFFIEDKVQKLNIMKCRIPACLGALAWDISKIGVCGNNNILMGPLLTAQFSCDCYRQGKGWSLVLLVRVGREYMWGPFFGGAGKRKNCSRTNLRVKRISA